MRHGRLLFALALACLPLTVSAQEASVANVSFTQSPSASGTQVDIYYDFSSSGGNCTITAALSLDGGTSFPVNVATATGDIGTNIVPGSGKHIVWNIAADWPGHVATGSMIRVVASLPDPGVTYALGFTNATFWDATRGRSIPAQVWYPAAVAGQDVPVAGGGGVTFPVIVFGHGTLSNISAYEYLWTGFVPSGYILVMLNTETGATPSTTDYAQDMEFLANQFQLEGANPASRFYQKVAVPTAMMGHSMGGAGAMYAAGLYNGNGVVTTIVPIACADMGLNIAGTAAPYVAIPALFISGSKDCMAPVSLQEPMFDVMPAACKYLISITAASHCQFSSVQNWCDTGETIMGCHFQTFIDRGVQMGMVISLAKPWLDFKLKGFDSGRVQFQQYLAANLSTGAISEPRTGTCTFGNWDLSNPGPLDALRPTVASVTVLTARSIQVTFSEALLSSGTTTPANYVLSGTGIGNLTANPTAVSGSGPFVLTWPSGEMLNGGTATVTVSNVRDTVGNFIDASNSGSGTGIGSLPTGSVLINGGAALTASADVLLSLSASDADSGVSAMQFSNNGTNWSGWEPFASSRTWALLSGDGAKTVYAQYRDGAGNVSTGTISAGITLDATPPAPIITGSSTPTNALRTLTIDFGEIVHGLTLDKVVVANGTAGNLRPSGSASSYQVDVMGSGQVTVSVSVAARAASDAAGNPSLPTAAPFTYSFDNLPPTPVISGSTSATNAPRTLTINFGETVSGLALGEILVTNGVAGNLRPTGSAASYQVDVFASGSVTVSVSVAGGAVTDGLGNVSNPSAAFTYLYDEIAPAPLISGSRTLTNSSRTLTINFNENVTSFSLPSGVSVVHGTASNLRSTGTPGVYNVDVLGSGANTVLVSIPGGAARDDATNPSEPSAPFTFPFDGVPPAPVISGSHAATNATKTLTIDFGENVDDVGLLWNLVVVNGAASNLQPEGTPGVYTVDILGSEDGTVSLSIPSGIVADDAGNSNLSTTAPFEFAFDTLPPTAMITLDGSALTEADTLAFSVDFSEPLAAPLTASSVSFPMPPGSLTGAIAVTGSGASYTVTVTLSDPGADGSLGIVVSGAALTDAAGNPYAGGASPFYTVRNWHGFTAQPEDAPLYTGDSLVFAADADFGPAVRAFQWKWTDAVAHQTHDGPAAASWNLSNLAPNSSGEYWCEAFYLGTTYPTRHAALSVADHLEIAQQPRGAELNSGAPYTFDVVTTGGHAPLSFQWQKDGAAITGSTSASYSIAEVEAADGAVYHVEVRDGHTDIRVSDDAVLTVLGYGIPVSEVAGMIALTVLLVVRGVRRIRKSQGSIAAKPFS